MIEKPYQFAFDLVCRDKTLHLGRSASTAIVMGILNVTPDSFSDGGLYLDTDHAVDRALEMVGEGAKIIDVGGASSRPAGRTYGIGADTVATDDEIARIRPVIEGIRKQNNSIVISVDTFNPAVARAAIDAGADIVNDITGLRQSDEMVEVIRESGAAVVLMHSPGLPGAMAHEQRYDSMMEAVDQSLRESVRIADRAGIYNVCVDPGFGFGKTFSDNFRLLNHLDDFLCFGLPVLVGVSRKAMIGAALGSIDNPYPVEGRVTGSLAAAQLAVSRGASIVRTHDIGETVGMLRVLTAAETEHVD